MNKAQRKIADDLLAQLNDLKGKVESIGSQLREMADEEQEKFDNMPEGLQASEQGQAIEAAAGALSEAAEYAEAGSVNEAVEALEGLE